MNDYAYVKEYKYFCGLVYADHKINKSQLFFSQSMNLICLF